MEAILTCAINVCGYVSNNAGQQDVSASYARVEVGRNTTEPWSNVSFPHGPAIEAGCHVHADEFTMVPGIQ